MNNNEVKLSYKESYEVMLHFLNNWLDLTDDNDLTNILSGGVYWKDGEPGDSAFYEYWLEAIDKHKKDGPIYISISK